MIGTIKYRVFTDIFFMNPPEAIYCYEYIALGDVPF
tara:strand:- start:240 stop:347 length:108 start_codon:yes stop_codon:yes gene_type:complete